MPSEARRLKAGLKRMELHSRGIAGEGGDDPDPTADGTEPKHREARVGFIVEMPRGTGIGGPNDREGFIDWVREKYVKRKVDDPERWSDAA